MGGLTKAYVLKRIGMFLLTVWLGTTVIFIIPRLAAGDPVEAMIGRMVIKGARVENAAELIEAYRVRFGLDKPVHIQYLRFLYNTITLDSGYSLSLFPSQVDRLVQRRMPWTIGLLSIATVMAFVLGNIIGALLAWRGTPRLAKMLLPLSLTFTSIPAFMLGVLLLYIFSYTLDWLPFGGAYDRTVTPCWDWDFVWSVIKHGTLPALAVVLVRMGSWALGMRGMMITAAGEDYMILAEAKGLSPWRVFWSYGMRNAILPQVTNLGMTLGSIAAGFVIVELVFAYPGIGYLLYEAILANDYTLMGGIVFYIIVGVGLAVLILDLIYPLIDPRITYKKG